MGETAEVYEEAPMPPEQEIAQLKKRIEHQRELWIESRRNERRYNALKRLEVVIMAEDGAKYLKGDEYDAYLDSLSDGSVRAQALNRAQFTEAAKAVLVEAFDSEYAKTHADKLAVHIDAEVMKNVKT